MLSFPVSDQDIFCFNENFKIQVYADYFVEKLF